MEAYETTVDKLTVIDTCNHLNKKFLYTREDWYEGDEDDIYECCDCKARLVEYISR